MDTSKFAEPRAFQVDDGWYDSYWLRPVRPHASRGIAQVLATQLAKLGRLTMSLLRARRAPAVRPATSVHA